MIRAALLALIAAASPITAAQVSDCDRAEANARNLARPFSEATREYANGNIALIYLLQDEPACCGAAVMVTVPDPEIGYGTCHFVTSDDGMGWSSLSLPGATAAYDAAKGLTITVPGTRFDQNRQDFAPFLLQIVVNQADAGVEARDH